MKRFVCALLMVLLLSLFSGCSKNKPGSGVPKKQDSEMLRICIDLGFVYNEIDDPGFQRDFRSQTLVMKMIEAGNAKGVDVPRKFEIEYLPVSGSERETALQRIRTEVMSGGGPDLFIAACSEKYPIDENEALFTMPEKAMELALFMPLDEYMENNTYFAEWDEMNQTVLAAGRNEEGQQIIPMCYTLPVAVYRAADAEHTPSKEITWTDMLESEDEALRAAAVWTRNYDEYREGSSFVPLGLPMTEFLLGEIADYKEEELLFTEEELVGRLQEIQDLADRYEAGEFDTAPPHYFTYMGREFDNAQTMCDINGTEYDMRAGIEQTEAYSMIPLYSDDGGVTAEIMAYMAINRNAKYPEEAFRVLDYLMSFSEQMIQRKMGSLYSTMLSQIYPGVPMYNELMQEEHRLVSPNDGNRTGWYLTDENFAAWCEVREQITHVKFRNELDKQFIQAYRDYYEAARQGEDSTEVVAESYRNMQRMLRE